MLHLDRVTTTAKIQTKLLPTGMKCRRQTNGRIQGTLYITFQIERHFSCVFALRICDILGAETRPLCRRFKNYATVNSEAELSVLSSI